MGRGRPHNLKLTPLQRDVVWILEEAGEENVPAVLATLNQSRNDEVAESELQEAIDPLVSIGFIRIGAEQSDFLTAKTLILTSQGHAAIFGQR
jgi:hypothetical protein